jgi:CAAX protease family protein
MFLLPSFAILLWAYVWIRLKSTRTTAGFGLGQMTFGRLAIGIGGGGLAALASMGLVFLTRPLVGEPDNIVLKMVRIAGGMSPALAVVILLIAVVTAPVWEELLFRGALYGWCRGRLGVAASAVLVAIAHAALHLDPAVAPALALIFIWFALLYEWTGNLWVPILAHATNNALAVVGVWLYLAGWLD